MPDGFFDVSDRTPPIKWPHRAINQENVAPGDSDQWLRKLELTLSGSSGGSDELKLAGSVDPDTGKFIGFKIVFRVRKTTLQSPNLFDARIYNLKKETMIKAIEYKKVVLKAGYQRGRYGKIYEGTVVQFKRGKENPVDTYLEVMAGDGDTAANFDGVVFQQWDAGTDYNKVAQDMIDRLQGLNQDVSRGTVELGDYGKKQLIRSFTQAGMARDSIRVIGQAANASFWIDDGKANLVANNKYVPGETVVLAPTTGLIGQPEVTPQGIQARCLLNPLLVLGGLVKIDSDFLSGVPFEPGTAATKKDGDVQGQFPNPAGDRRYPEALRGQQLQSAWTSPVGTYKILLLEHNGDTRGNSYYSDLICVALDGSGNAIWSTDLPFSRASANAWGGSLPGHGDLAPGSDGASTVTPPTSTNQGSQSTENTPGA